MKEGIFSGTNTPVSNWKCAGNTTHDFLTFNPERSHIEQYK
jgi:hypothetical protein